MSLRTPTCPSCAAALELTRTGELDVWQCPMLHGVGMTLSEAHGRLQNDEVAELWRSTREAMATSVSGGTRACPICAAAMTSVLVTADADEVADGEAGDGSTTGSAWIDVCEPCQLIWFDNGEIDEFPVDLPDAGPSAAEVQALALLTDHFGDAYVQAVHDRENGTFTERAYQVVARNPRVLAALTSVGRLGRD